jgi:cobaltochelatase CobS
MATQIETLENIIATTTNDAIRLQAEQELATLRLSMQPQQTAAVATNDADAAVLQALLDAMQNALRKGTGSVNMADLRQAINQELQIRKISESDLSPQLLSKLQSSRPVTLNIVKGLGITTSKSVKSSMLERPLTQLILSDYLARNNVYLYGGAGTGKTFIAEQIADLLGWEKITLNCNQFTSPLDILGGQTIDGYQEGKLSMAWSNNIVDSNGIKKVDGCVLILDELPKIDPNTAGILNEALAKIKDFKYNDQTGQNDIPPTIRNGKNEVLPLGNLFVIATGNVPLNTIDPDYEANFKQDLSLQDRFIGSTYKVFVDYKYEFEDIMKGFAFIWIFLVKCREAAVKYKATGQAFVSLRLMINAKATYITYRDVKMNSGRAAKASTSGNAISSPKTLIDTMDGFFILFKPSVRDAIVNEVNYDEFKRIVNDKNLMPYDPTNPNFDDPQELAMGAKMVADYMANQSII